MAHILIVDDDDQIRRMLRRRLERDKHQITEAADGEQALQACRNSTIDLALIDIIMPEKEGTETIMELQKNNPDLQIIAMSGGSSYITPEMSLKLALQFGARAALQKPFSLDELISTINSLLA